MAQLQSTTVRLKVSPEVARIVKPGAPRDVQIAAARGALPLVGKDLLTVLFFLCRSSDAEIRKAAVITLRGMPETILSPVLKDGTLHPQLIDLLVKARVADEELMGTVIMHVATTLKTLLYLAGKASSGVLERLAGHQNLLHQNPELVAAIISNPAAEKNLKFRLGWKDPETTAQTAADLGADAGEAADANVDTDEEERSQAEIEAMAEDEEGLSKYQITMNLKVAEKIKMGLTGDRNGVPS